MTIQETKKFLVKKYGKRPSICYYYYLCNVVNYIGEKRVRESFDSIKGQGNEVIIGDCGSTDNTLKLAKEYGFKFISVEKDRDSIFPESKIRNRVISLARSNFLVPLNINVEYPENFTTVIKEWIRNNDITKRYLKFRTQKECIDGKLDGYYGFSSVFYKPYLLYARGYDERTSYAAGSQTYGVFLLRDIYKLNAEVIDLSLVHKYHNDKKRPIVSKLFPNTNIDDLRKNRQKVVKALIGNMQPNLKKGLKKVRNSYW